MATLESTLQTALKALAVGGCFPLLNPSLPAVLPYITYQMVSAIPEADLEGMDGNDHVRMQVDAWAATYGGAKALAASIRSTMQTSFPGAVIEMQQDFYEEVTKEYRVMTDFMLWKTN